MQVIPVETLETLSPKAKKLKPGEGGEGTFAFLLALLKQVDVSLPQKASFSVTALPKDKILQEAIISSGEHLLVAENLGLTEKLAQEAENNGLELFRLLLKQESNEQAVEVNRGKVIAETKTAAKESTAFQENYKLKPEVLNLINKGKPVLDGYEKAIFEANTEVKNQLNNQVLTEEKNTEVKNQGKHKAENPVVKDEATALFLRKLGQETEKLGQEEKAKEIPGEFLKDTETAKKPIFEKIPFELRNQVNSQELNDFYAPKKPIMQNQNSINFSEVGSFSGSVENTFVDTPLESTEPSLPVKELPEFVFKQLKARLVMNKPDGSAEINLKIHPEELGRLNLRLSLTDGQVSVRILTENSYVRDLVEQHLVHLKESLNNQGIKCTTVEVQVGSDGNFQQHLGQSANSFHKSFTYGQVKSGYGKVSNEFFTEEQDSSQYRKLGLSNLEILA